MPTLDESGLTLVWPESAGFSKRQAEDPEKRDLLSQAIRAVTGAAGDWPSLNSVPESVTRMAPVSSAIFASAASGAIAAARRVICGKSTAAARVVAGFVAGCARADDVDNASDDTTTTVQRRKSIMDT